MWSHIVVCFIIQLTHRVGLSVHKLVCLGLCMYDLFSPLTKWSCKCVLFPWLILYMCIFISQGICCTYSLFLCVCMRFITQWVCAVHFSWRQNVSTGSMCICAWGSWLGEVHWVIVVIHLCRSALWSQKSHRCLTMSESTQFMTISLESLPRWSSKSF